MLTGQPVTCFDLEACLESERQYIDPSGGSLSSGALAAIERGGLFRKCFGRIYLCYLYSHFVLLTGTVLELP